jgi:preprotein translocase subunit SecD
MIKNHRSPRPQQFPTRIEDPHRSWPWVNQSRRLGLLLFFGICLVACQSGPERAGDLKTVGESGAEEDQLTLVVTIDADDRAAADTRETVTRVMARRLEHMGPDEVQIHRYGADEIHITLPPLDEAELEQTIELLKAPAEVGFFRVADDEAGQACTQLSHDLPDGVILRPTPAFPYSSLTHRQRAPLEEFLADNAPQGRIFAYQFQPAQGDEESYWRAVLLHESPDIDGRHVESAAMEIDDIFNHPFVVLNLTPEGTDIFAAVTTELVNDRLAIVVDNEVLMAPVIAEPVLGGSVRFSPGSDKSYREALQDSENMAVLLNSGPLRTPVNIEVK